MEYIRMSLFMIFLIIGLNFIYVNGKSIFDAEEDLNQFILQNHRYILTKYHGNSNIFNPSSKGDDLIQFPISTNEINQVIKEFNEEYFAMMMLRRIPLMNNEQKKDYNRLMIPKETYRSKKMTSLQTCVPHLLEHLAKTINKKNNNLNQVSILFNKHLHAFAKFINAEMQSMTISLYSFKNQDEKYPPILELRKQNFAIVLSHHQSRMKYITDLFYNIIKEHRQECRLSKPDCQFLERLKAIRSYYTTTLTVN